METCPEWIEHLVERLNMEAVRHSAKGSPVWDSGKAKKLILEAFLARNEFELAKREEDYNAEK